MYPEYFHRDMLNLSLQFQREYRIENARFMYFRNVNNNTLVCWSFIEKYIYRAIYDGDNLIDEMEWDL